MSASKPLSPFANYPEREALREAYVKRIEDGCRQAEEHLPKTFPIKEGIKRKRQEIWDAI